MASFASFKAEIDEWVKSPGVASQESISRAAQDQIEQDVRAVEQDTEVTITASGNTLMLPTDYLTIRSLAGIDSNISYELRPGSSTGRPAQGTVFYSIIENEIVFQEDVDDDTEFKVVYIRPFDRLEDDTDSNWLLENRYQIYLTSFLRWAFLFTQDLEMFRHFDTMYRQELEEFHITENRKRFTYGNLRQRINLEINNTGSNVQSVNKP